MDWGRFLLGFDANYNITMVAIIDSDERTLDRIIDKDKKTAVVKGETMHAFIIAIVVDGMVTIPIMDVMDHYIHNLV